MKRILSLIVAFLLTFTTFFSSVNISYANETEPTLTAQYAVLMDYETGTVLYDKNGSEKLYPASTTKVWTAYVVLKYVSDLNDVIKIENLPPIDGTSMYLRNGESFTVKELLESLLVHSSNDVAYVLANYVSGSIEKFVELMNSEAKAIGAKNTHFNNPHGLPDENHFTTAYDMALMSREAMNNKVFRDMVNLKYVKYKPNEFYEYERSFLNSNKFFNSSEKINYKGQEIPIKYDVVDGIKTGFTNDAGRCLLSSAVKDNMRVISTVFKTTGNDVYLDSRTLIDYGLDNFKSATIVNKSDFTDSVDVKLSKQGKLVYEPAHSYKVVLSKDNKVDDYKTNVKLDKINLPIKKGDKVGTLEIYKDNKLESNIDLIATDNVNSIFSFITENKALHNILKLVVMFVTILTIIIVILIIRKNIRRKNRRNKNNIYNINSKKKKRK